MPTLNPVTALLLAFGLIIGTQQAAAVTPPRSPSPVTPVVSSVSYELDRAGNLSEVHLELTARVERADVVLNDDRFTCHPTGRLEWSCPTAPVPLRGLDSLAVETS